MAESALPPPAASQENAEPPLRSVHTTSFPQILAEAAASVLVTTYQAGKLVILRNDAGVLNTHFRNFTKPMGLAYAGGRLAIGTAVEVAEFHNVPAVCPRLDEKAEAELALANNPPAPSPSEGRAGAGGEAGTSDATSSRGVTPPPTPPHPGEGSGEGIHSGSPNPKSKIQNPKSNHDACFLPRSAHTTGDVAIHEMAWVGEELWFVNTAFSCLATRSAFDSFEPRWRPPFIKQLRPGDCCHLNGLALRDGRVRYVTALGATDEPGGWRDGKRDGGVLMDVDTGDILVRGLSMPHSPRWYAGRLWLLESGDGSFGYIDFATGRYEPIVKLPGFTRGLSFLGPLAFIGLSQVRESAVFSGIPLVERLQERTCGVWVVRIDTGATVAFVRFEDAVQEIFAVEALAGIRYPDLINHDLELIGTSYVLPEAALAEVPADLRSK
jgi:uncharacterized protein (TIGR03032 family)